MMRNKSFEKHEKISFKDCFDKAGKRKTCENSNDKKQPKKYVEKKLKNQEMQPHWRFKWCCNSTFIPEEMRLKKKMVMIGEKIVHCKTEVERLYLIKQFSLLSHQYHFCMEYNGRIEKFRY